MATSKTLGRYFECIVKSSDNRVRTNSKTELFLTATVIGVLNNKKSEKNPNGTNILDFIKLRPDIAKELIYLLTEVTGPRDEGTSYHDVLRYADGGLALIWEEYRNQGTFDVTRLIEESKAKWQKRIEELNILREETELDKILGERESASIEYKSSLIWDYDAKKENKKLLGGIVARAIASFMNVNGGLLLIGVSDNKKILGLDKDLNVLPKHSLGQFEEHFTNVIQSYLGVENILHCNIQLRMVQGKAIATVEIPKKTPKPVFWKSDGDEALFVRANNTSRRIPNSQVHDYIKQNWPDLK
jgi:hypothetical protein